MNVVDLKTFQRSVNYLKPIEAWTDGACKGNPGPGGWGALLRQGNMETEIKGGSEQTTNNRMEMMAAIETLSAIPSQNTPITISTDSQYLRDGITKWISGWKAKGWVTSNKTPVKNQELWIKLDNLCDQHKVYWTWVKGHNGHPENERADRLAVAGIPNSKKQTLNKNQDYIETNMIQPPTVPAALVVTEISFDDFMKTAKKSIPLEIQIQVQVINAKGGWAAAFSQENRTAYTSGFIMHTTLPQLELLTAINCIEMFSTPYVINMVYNPDQYIYKGITSWIKGWESNGWTTSSGSEVKYKDQWIKLNELCSSHHIFWKWILTPRQKELVTALNEKAKSSIAQAG